MRSFFWHACTFAATLTGYVYLIILLLDRIVFLESMFDNLSASSMAIGKYELNKNT